MILKDYKVIFKDGAQRFFFRDSNVIEGVPMLLYIENTFTLERKLICECIVLYTSHIERLSYVYGKLSLMTNGSIY